MDDAIREWYPENPPVAMIVCECGGHAFTVHADDSERFSEELRHVALAYWERAPRAYGLRERLRRAWAWLRGRPDLLMDDLILNEREAVRLRNALIEAIERTWPKGF